MATGMIVVPASLGPLAAPERWPFSLVVILGLVVVAALDALRAHGRLDGISASLPELTRLTKDKEGAIAVKILREKPSTGLLRLALSLPSEFHSGDPSLTVVFAKEEGEFVVQWTCTPLKRGNYTLEKVYIAADSPLRLWSCHAALSAPGELRVYPNIHQERKNLAALFLNRGLMGIHAQRQVGKGRDFEQLREYIPGDSFEDIHWKATARRGVPVTKIYQIERTQEVYVIIDTSRLSGREVLDAEGKRKTSQLERFINAAMVLALVAERQGDHFGLLTFDDRVRHFLHARNGKAHFDACRDAVYTLEPKPVNPDFEELCTFIRLRMPKRALLIVLTNLDDPVLSESFVRNVDLISSHHLVLVNMLVPRGVRPLFSSDDVETLDDLYAHLGGHMEWRDLIELKSVLHFHGATLSLLRHETMTADLVSQYINQKQRQLL